jgi:hypothetical protein
LSGTLQTITDQSSNASPLQLSTTNVAMTFADTSGLFFGPYSSGGVYSGIWDNKIAVKNTTNFSLLSGSGETYLNANSGLFFSISGPSTPLMNLTTSGFAIGQSTTSASARLHVRGDGTNPIARFESNDGSINWRFSAGGFGLENSYQAGIFGAAISGDYSFAAGSYNNLSGTGAFQGIANISGTIAVPTSGTGNKHILAVNYTINNAGAQTGTATGIFLNATETALNGMGHNLLDLQVGGVSRCKATSAGVFLSNTFVTSNEYQFSVGTRIRSTDANGRLLIGNSNLDNFGLLQFGGTTNAFPAIKRSGAGIQIRLADDSDFALFDSAAININHTSDGVLSFTKAGTNSFSFQKDAARIYFYNNTLAQPAYSITNNNAIVFGNSFDAVLSAQLEIVSTTKGFLPPRMTTSEVNAIASPAEGLVVFNTTISHLCVYQSGGWVKMNHSPM